MHLPLSQARTTRHLPRTTPSLRCTAGLASTARDRSSRTTTLRSTSSSTTGSATSKSSEAGSRSLGRAAPPRRGESPPARSGATGVRADCPHALPADRRHGGPGTRSAHLHLAARRFSRHGAAGGARLLQRIQHIGPGLHCAFHPLHPGSSDQRRPPAGRAWNVGRLRRLDRRPHQPTVVRHVRGQRDATGHHLAHRGDQSEHRLRLCLRARSGHRQHAVELFDVRRRARPHPRTSARGRRPEAAVEARPQHVSRNPERDHFRLAISRAAGVLMKRVSRASSPHPAARRPPSPASGEGNRRQSGQVMMVLTLALPISFGNYLGTSSTNVTRRAVAQQLNGSTAAVTATTLSCTGGQVNVSGSVIASNAISLSGSCALYVHQRYAATSGTYSDLGNVSDYTNGQAWVGGGGTCTPVASNAICTDGYELSGHTAMTCGTTGTSAFLSVPNQAINPNPCAAGKAPQPVAALAATLPPEPNTDAAAIATLQGTGGAACTAGGAYPNIVVGGVTVATGRGPRPTKDASGFYHFKPSCYGYIDLTSMAGGISNRQIGPEREVDTQFIIATLPAASQAGTLLVATVSAASTPNKFAAPAGWISAAEANQVGEGRSEIWYYPNNPGGISSITFTMNPATIAGNAQMSEWSGADTAPLDQSGSSTVLVPTASTVIATSGAMAQTGELVITGDGFTIPAGQTSPRGAGCTGLATA